MEKPIVLKQKFRLDWVWAIGFALSLGILAWGFWRGSVELWFWSPCILLMNGSVFFARVTLEQSQINVWHSLTDTRRHRFVRILRYLVKPHGDRLDVELTIEQMWPQKSELFGVEFSWKRRVPSIQEKNISFSVELQQAEVLMNYLHAQCAVEDVFAETEWQKLQGLLVWEREVSRLEREQEGELPNDDK